MRDSLTTLKIFGLCYVCNTGRNLLKLATCLLLVFSNFLDHFLTSGVIQLILKANIFILMGRVMERRYTGFHLKMLLHSNPPHAHKKSVLGGAFKTTNYPSFLVFLHLEESVFYWHTKYPATWLFVKHFCVRSLKAFYTHLT